MAKVTGEGQHFLPDFGSFRVAIRIIILGVLIASIITIGRNEFINEKAWQDLNLLAGYALILSLFGILALKLFAPLIQRMTVIGGSLFVFVLMLLVIVLGTEVMVFALYDLKLTPSAGRTGIIRCWCGASSSAPSLSLSAALPAGRAPRRNGIARRAGIASAGAAIAHPSAFSVQQHELDRQPHPLRPGTRRDRAPGPGRPVPRAAGRCPQAGADLGRARDLAPVPGNRETAVGRSPQGDLACEQRAALGADPALTLQPLLENAIYHGIEPRFQGGTLRIEMWGEGESLNIMISNPLPDVPKHAHGKGNKIALENIRMRLESHFGNGASMQALQEGGQYHVKIKMPIVRG